MNICSDNYDPKGYSLLINMQLNLFHMLPLSAGLVKS